jgi:hypothetical protein
MKTLSNSENPLVKAAAEFAPSLIGQYFKGKILTGCVGIIVRLSDNTVAGALLEQFSLLYL